MVENTKIGWARHTFNPWIGCTNVSPGCDNCYAEDMDKRWRKGQHWGAGAPRHRTSAANWKLPLKWNKLAKQTGDHPWVFCLSLGDWADNEVPPEWRADLFDLIRQTPYLRWQLLTKRIGNAAKFLPEDWASGAFDHVGLMATCVNQVEFDRDVLKLLSLPAAWHGVSLEPMLETIVVRKHLLPQHSGCHNRATSTKGRNAISSMLKLVASQAAGWHGLDWIVIGGESGNSSRLFPVDSARQIIADCVATDVPVFMKQMGRIQSPSLNLKHRKGEDMSEWPMDMQIQQMPRFEVAA